MTTGAVLETAQKRADEEHRINSRGAIALTAPPHLPGLKSLYRF